MDIGSSFTFMFEDENWIKKILIGGLVAFVPIVNFAAMGYMVQVVRNVRDGQSLPLPEWDQFGQYFMDGLWLFVICLVWLIPVIVLSCIQGVGTTVMAENNDLSEVYGILSICFGCLIFLWSIVFALAWPAIMVNYAEAGEVMAGFRFGEIFSIIKANIGSYIIVVLLILLASFVASFGVILCGVGILFTQFWSYLVTGNLVGQFAAQRQSSELAV